VYCLICVATPLVSPWEVLKKNSLTEKLIILIRKQIQPWFIINFCRKCFTYNASRRTLILSFSRRYNSVTCPMKGQLCPFQEFSTRHGAVMLAVTFANSWSPFTVHCSEHSTLLLLLLATEASNRLLASNVDVCSIPRTSAVRSADLVAHLAQWRKSKIPTSIEVTWWSPQV